MVSSLKEYESISNSFQKEGFYKVKAPWTFYSGKYNVVIDLLPFGELEEKDTLTFTERYADLHILGFKEVLEEAEEVFIENKIVNVPPLPGMVILKLIAWSDRPEERDNDLADILRIIEHYFEYNFDEIIEYHNDTFPEEGFDKWLISAEVLGRKSKQYLEKSNELTKRVKKVLDTNLSSEMESNISRKWAGIKDWDIEYAFQILKYFRKGLGGL